MLDLINSITALSVIKIAFLLITGIYIAFLLVVFKQARAMAGVIRDNSASGILNSIALFNVLIGILIFVAALVIL
jgi:hypothetical protein